MDYFLTEEQQMIVDISRQITDAKIIPQRAELDEKEEYATEILNDIAGADLFGLYIPEEYGGLGQDFNSNTAIAMEMGKIKRKKTLLYSWKSFIIEKLLN